MMNTENNRRCANCGHEMTNPNATFCPACGARVAVRPAGGAAAPAAQFTANMTSVVVNAIAFIASVIFLIVISAALFGARRGYTELLGMTVRMSGVTPALLWFAEIALIFALIVTPLSIVQMTRMRLNVGEKLSGYGLTSPMGFTGASFSVDYRDIVGISLTGVKLMLITTGGRFYLTVKDGQRAKALIEQRKNG